jgi:hypothetical protein
MSEQILSGTCSGHVVDSQVIVRGPQETHTFRVVCYACGAGGTILIDDWREAVGFAKRQAARACRVCDSRK